MKCQKSTGSQENNSQTYCGYVGLIGRPNVGKSTLLNHILAQKVAITSSKAQTTRHRIVGVLTQDNYQSIFLDTPGIHARRTKRALNRRLNRAAVDAISDVDVIVMLVEALRWSEEDDFVLKQLACAKVPVILAVNKIDKVKDKTTLLPFLQHCAQQFNFCAILPISASKESGLPDLLRCVQSYLPVSDHFFGVDTITDQSRAFRSSEIIREKLTRVLGEELPYVISVEIDSIDETDKLVSIQAMIWVERESQKGIIIGKSGQLLKAVGKQARLDLQKLYNKKVFLRLWVKTRAHGADDEAALSRLGHGQ